MPDMPPQKPDDSLTPKRLAEIAARLSDVTQRVISDGPVVGDPVTGDPSQSAASSPPSPRNPLSRAFDRVNSLIGKAAVGAGRFLGRLIGEDDLTGLLSKPDVPITMGKSHFGGKIADAEQWAMRNLRREFPVTNADTGWSISAGRQAIEKITNQKAVKKSDSVTDHIDAIPHLPDLLKHAVLAETHKDHEDNPRVEAFHRLFAPLQVGDRLHRVKLTVKELASQPNRPAIRNLKTHELVQIEMPARTIVGGNQPEPLASNAHAGKISVSDLLSGANKSETGKTHEPIMPQSFSGRMAKAAATVSRWGRGLRGFATGGDVSSSPQHRPGLTDTIPALLSPGEVVLNQSQQHALESATGQPAAKLFAKAGVPGFAGGGTPDEPPLSPRQRVIAKLGLQPPLDEPTPADELAAEERVQEVRRQRRAEGQYWESLRAPQRRVAENIVTAEGGIPLDEPINQPHITPPSGATPTRPTVATRIVTDDVRQRLIDRGYTNRRIDNMPPGMAESFARSEPKTPRADVSTPSQTPVVAETKTAADRLIQAADKLTDAADAQKDATKGQADTYRMAFEKVWKPPSQSETSAASSRSDGKLSAETLKWSDLRPDEQKLILAHQPELAKQLQAKEPPPVETFGFGESWKPPTADEIAKEKEIDRYVEPFKKVISPYKLRPWEPSPADKTKARYTTKGEEIKPLDPSQAENAPRASQMPSALEPFFAMIPGGYRLRRLAHLFSGTSRGAQRDSLSSTGIGRGVRSVLGRVGRSRVGKNLLGGKYGQGAATVSRMVMQQVSGMARTTAGRAVIGGTLGGMAGGPLGGIGGGLMGSGIGGAAGMAVGGVALGAGVVIGFTKAVIDAKNALAKFGDTVNEGNRRFTTYNGSIAAAFNRLDIGRIRRDIETGRATEGSSVAVAEWKNRFEQAGQPLREAAGTVTNTAAVGALAIATGLEKLFTIGAKQLGVLEAIKELEKLIAEGDPNQADPTQQAAANMLGVNLQNANAPNVKPVREPVDWLKLLSPLIAGGQAVPLGKALGDWLGRQVAPPVWNPGAKKKQDEVEDGRRLPLEPVR